MAIGVDEGGAGVFDGGAVALAAGTLCVAATGLGFLVANNVEADLESERFADVPAVGKPMSSSEGAGELITDGADSSCGRSC
jgi:hypothetical protein